MENSGAKAALKGYRLQTVYIIDAILSSTNKDLVFQPEGHEDLAIYQNDRLVQVVQIKARIESLALSSFKPQNKDSFFHRILKLLHQDQTLSVCVASFGEVGDEINLAWHSDGADRNRIRTKLGKYGINDKQMMLLINSIRWQRVSEAELYKRCYDSLNKTLTAGSPKNALSLLTAWLYEASEHKSKITHQDLIDKIIATGKYLAEREAHHEHWFKSISLLMDMPPTNTEQLADEYYKGISIRFNHIQAGLDINRTAQLSTINTHFKHHQTVIIHGASGQGKTSLAYRYLYDFVPEDWRLQINFVEDRHHAHSIALAVADHLAVFNATLYLYIDVSPRDMDWTALVKSLLDKPNIKILVSIREEDLARQNIGSEELGLPAAVSLQFSKSEAQFIYANLTEKGIAQPYPSFEQAWLGFGEEGSLLEYIYFLTQTESLSAKLAAQVRRIRNEVSAGKLEKGAVNLLLGCAVATAYEARIRIDLLVEQIDLNDPAGTFALFEDEYLLRRSNDQLHVEALHPIRSRILVSILADPAFSPWIKAALTVMPCLEESDLETFLLYSFIEQPQQFEPLFNQLKVLGVKSWIGAVGICRALLWYGICCHVLENQQTIGEARLLYGTNSWSLLLLTDVGGVFEDGEDPIAELISSFAEDNPQQALKNMDLRNKITPVESVYQYLEQWLSSVDCEIAKPTSDMGWTGMGEVLFWSGRLQVALTVDISWLKSIDLHDCFSTIEPLAALSVGLYYFDNALHQQVILSEQYFVKELFQTSTNTIWLEEDGDILTAHFIVPANYVTDGETSEMSLNDLSVKRAQLLSQLFPEKQKYGTKGYGHQSILLDEVPYDESVKMMPIKPSMADHKLPSLNAAWANFADYRYRPDNWLEYAQNIIVIRQRVVAGLVCLNKALASYFKKKRAASLFQSQIDIAFWEKLYQLKMHTPLFPKSTVDPWGYTSERTLNTNEKNDESAKGGNNQRTLKLLSIQSHYESYHKAFSDYMFSLNNFFQQSSNILVVNGLIGRLPKEQHQEVFEKAAELKVPYSDQLLHLSAINLDNAHRRLIEFQIEFRKHFHNIIEDSVLDKLDKQEKDKFAKAWSLWYQFAHDPDKYWKNSPDVRAMAIVNTTTDELLRSVENALTLKLPKGLIGTILSDGYEYGGEKALWIGVELAELDALEYCFTSVIDALTTAIRPIKYKDLKFFVLDNRWKHAVIVPTIGGRALSNVSWVILMGSFVGEETVIDNGKPWLYMPRPIEQSALDYFDFKENLTAESEAIKVLDNALKELFLTINYCYCFRDLEPNLTGVGREILQQHLIAMMPEFNQHTGQATEVIDGLRSNIAEENNDGDMSLLLDILEMAVNPYEQSAGNQVVIELTDCEEWARMLNNGMIELNNYKWQGLF